MLPPGSAIGRGQDVRSALHEDGFRQAPLWFGGNSRLFFGRVLSVLGRMKKPAPVSTRVGGKEVANRELLACCLIPGRGRIGPGGHRQGNLRVKTASAF